MNNDTSNYQVTRRLIMEVIMPYWRPLLVSILLMVVISATVSFQALLIQPAVDNTLFSTSAAAQDSAKKIIEKVSLFEKIKNELNISDSEYLLYLMPALVILTCFMRGVATFFQLSLTQVTTVRLNNSLRERLYRRFLYGDMEEFNNSSSGKMVSNIIFDINGMIGAINIILSGVFKQFLTLVFLVMVMFYINFKLSLIAMVGLPVAIFPLYQIYKKLSKYLTTNQSQLEQFTVLIDDSLRSIKVVKSYNAEEYEMSRLKESLNDLLTLQKKIARTANIASPLNETLLGISIALVLFYGGSMVLSGESTPGSFFAFFAAVMSAYKPAKSLGGLNVQLHICLVTARRVFVMLDSKQKVVDRIDAVPLQNCKGDIEFDNVGFGYIAERSALNGVTLVIEKGKTYALVGHSGAGKSTMFNLLLRFYDPTSGTVKVDGRDIRDYTIGSLRDNISYVGQDVQLFDTDIIHNIRYGNKNASDEEVEIASKLAEAHEFIVEMPQKYQTKVGQNGQKLSGGQRQRIALARAFVRNSPILLLDEATSALDPISERLIQAALEKLMKNRTTLIIAHRLSTVINADKIVVMSKGKIVDVGTHDELLAKSEIYKNLYQHNFSEDNNS